MFADKLTALVSLRDKEEKALPPFPPTPLVELPPVPA
jgi:hypothetical protein